MFSHKKQRNFNQKTTKLSNKNNEAFKQKTKMFPVKKQRRFQGKKNEAFTQNMTKLSKKTKKQQNFKQKTMRLSVKK